MSHSYAEIVKSWNYIITKRKDGLVLSFNRKNLTLGLQKDLMQLIQHMLWFCITIRKSVPCTYLFSDPWVHHTSEPKSSFPAEKNVTQKKFKMNFKQIFEMAQIQVARDEIHECH